jgi:flavorubredoxin
MGVELFNNGKHACVMFNDLVKDGGHAVQTNQFLIVDHEEGAILDPGGNMVFAELTFHLRKYLPLKDVKYILASHADPDVISSLGRWMSLSNANLIISDLWARFVPHFCKEDNTHHRIIGVSDSGGTLRLGRSEIVCLPAHFMHSEGNFQFYDPVSKILFSGDLGVSLEDGSFSSGLDADFPSQI